MQKSRATRRQLFCIFLQILLSAAVSAQDDEAKSGGPVVHKLQDIVIYSDDRFYSSFPSIIRKADGELVTAFRRAPERRRFGAASVSHTDPNSYLMLVRSRDEGHTWSQPELIYANPFGGSQDPCLLRLHDDTLLCSSYGWALLDPNTSARFTNAFHHGNFVFLGGYLLRSRDGAKTWENPIIPPSTPGETRLDLFGKTVPAYNRGAMCEGEDGRIFWVAAANTGKGRTETHLFISPDHGTTWTYSCPVGVDEKVGFNETSVYETPRGELVAFMRTENFNDHTAVARSINHGKSFQRWKDAQFQGHPHYALRLPDRRVLLLYGYRHAPFGVRARVLEPECTDISTAPEIVLRDDGGNGDLGYPWATLLSKDRALVVYYFNRSDGARFIAGTVLALSTN